MYWMRSFVGLLMQGWCQSQFLCFFITHVKLIDSILTCVCSLIDNRWGKNVVIWTSVSQTHSYHILMSSMIYYWTDFTLLTNLFWWVVSIILFSPELSIHLESHIIKINISANCINVLFTYIICCMLPIHVFWEIWQLFPVIEKMDVLVLSHTCKKKINSLRISENEFKPGPITGKHVAFDILWVAIWG